MRSIVIVLAFLVVAISSGVFATMLRAQDANTTLPPSFFGQHEGEVYKDNWSAFQNEDGSKSYATPREAVTLAPLEKRIAALEALVKDLKSCQCQCDCGKQKAAPEKPAAQPQWKIVMESIPNCGGCKWADENQRPTYINRGWQWETVHLPGPQPGVRMYPRYLICDGNTCEVIEIDQYVTELDAKLSELLARRNQQPVQDKRSRFLGNR